MLDLLFSIMNFLIHIVYNAYIFGVASWQAGWYFEDRTPIQNYIESLLKV